MVGVVQPVVRQHRETPLLGRHPLLAVLAELPADAHLAAFQPEVLETGGPTVLAGPAEGVDVVAADLAPVLERDAELERALHGADEVLLLDLQKFMQREQRGYRGFANADGADLVGLHDGDVQRLAQELG